MKLVLLGTASALLLLGAAGTANAAIPPGMSAQPYLVLQNEQRQDIKVAADLVQQSLARKADGTAAISDELCRTANSCATPLEIYTAIKQKHPDVMLGSLSELPGYMRSLIKVENPKPGARIVGRVLVEGNTRTLDWGMHREPFPQEVTWNDPNTGEEIFMGNCFNVIDLNIVDEVVVQAADCVVGRIPVGPHGHAARTAIYNQDGSPLTGKSVARCLAYKRVGETTWTQGWVDECAWGEIKLNDGRVTNCSLAAPTATIGKAVERQGGFLTKAQQGYIEVRLPPEFAREGTSLSFFVCHEEHELKPGQQFPEIRHSNGFYTTPDDFVKDPARADGLRVATFPVPTKWPERSIAFSLGQ